MLSIVVGEKLRLLRVFEFNLARIACELYFSERIRL